MEAKALGGGGRGGEAGERKEEGIESDKRRLLGVEINCFSFFLGLASLLCSFLFLKYSTEMKKKQTKND